MIQKILDTIPSIPSGAAVLMRRKELLFFKNPQRIFKATLPGEVSEILQGIEESVSAGRHTVGYLAYEAAAAFDPALAVHSSPEAPLAWFGIYDAVDTRIPIERRWFTEKSPESFMEAWRPCQTESEYAAAIERIHAYIEAGDTYQVNFTFPMETTIHGDAWECFLNLCAAQDSDYRVFMNTGEKQILSLSPELFFRLDGNRLETRPMKGTAPRGRTEREDNEKAVELAESPKEQAENVMIVDLLRNDMGRISRTGTVAVEQLFETERYDTLWQMTSTVTSRTEASFPAIMAALFPSGSVTGAPKVRAMQIIRELEAHPRGVYCGAIGWYGPDRQALFNVAIRTLTIDSRTGEARYSVGSGITWDARNAAEYGECFLKAKILHRANPPFALLETLRWEGDYFLKEEHLDRLSASAHYFGFPVNREGWEDALIKAGSQNNAARVICFRLESDGTMHTETRALPSHHPSTLSLARKPVSSTSVWLFHKTTQRHAYEEAAPEVSGAEAVLLWNERREITESTFANVMLRQGKEWFTPPVSSGLLDGVYRRHLMDSGRLRERPVLIENLAEYEEIRLINSVRGEIPVLWMDGSFD